MQIYQAIFAGRAVRYAFHYPKTARYFRSWLRPVEGTAYDVMATREEIERAHRLLMTGNPEDYAEYKALLGPTSAVLLRGDCCLFHAAAFRWQGRAWLLAAPSGTGKTTQFMNWRRLYPGEIIMICGDMPAVERRKDGSVWVHPTSWTGKENIGSFTPAPLGGIVWLEQGTENTIRPLPARESVPPLFGQFCIIPKTEEQAEGICRILDSMLRSCPVWKLTNRGDNASTELLRQTIAEAVKGEGHDPV